MSLNLFPLGNTGHVLVHKQTCAASTSRINGFLDTADLSLFFLHKEDIKWCQKGESNISSYGYHYRIG